MMPSNLRDFSAMRAFVASLGEFFGVPGCLEGKKKNEHVLHRTFVVGCAMIGW